jgi:hypothetical protein
MKTIRMKKEYLDKWLAALRSGKYKQGKHQLKTDSGAFCCLGVLQQELDGEVESQDGKPLQTPSSSWLKDKEITFHYSPLYSKTIGGCQNPHLPTLDTTAAEANDRHNKTFLEIADAIEEATETF